MNQNFTGANLQGKSFQNKDLSSTNFSGANLRGTDFRNAILTGANFSNVKAGLQSHWIIGIIIICLILGILSGYISGYVGGFSGSALVHEGYFSIPFWSTIVAIFVLGTFALATIRQGFGSSLGTLAFITALAAIIVASASRGEEVIANAVIFLVTQSLVIGGAVAGVMIGALAIALIKLVLKSNLVIFIGIISLISAIPGILEGLGDIPSQFLIIAWTIAILVTILVIFVVNIVGLRSGADEKKYPLIRTLAIIITTFRGTKFVNSTLTDADFTDAVLENTDFRRADLKRTCFYHVKELDKARCQGTYLENNQVRQLVITKEGQGCFLETLDLRGVNLDKANLEGARLRKVNLSEATLKEATLIEVDLTESNCRSIDLTDADLKNANLTGANLTLANLTNAELERASLIGANLTSANLKSAKLLMTKLVRAQLYRANLNNACLTAAYIEDWAISTDTQFNDVECDFVYMRLPAEDDKDQDPGRKPDNKNETFRKGDFADFIAPIIKTLDLYRHQNVDPRAFARTLKSLDLYHYEGIDPSAAAVALQQLAEKHPEAGLEIVALEGRGQDKIRLQAQVAGGINRSELSAEYFSTYNQLNDLPYNDLKALLAGIAEKDERISSLQEMVKIALKSDKSYMQVNYNLGDIVSEQVNIKAGRDISGVVNLGEIIGDVNNAVNQLPDSQDPEKQGIKELLMQLQAAIEAEPNLEPEDKAEALEQVKTLAEAGKTSEEGRLRKAAKTAIKILRGTVAGLPSAAKLVEECGKLLPMIAKLLGLSIL